MLAGKIECFADATARSNLNVNFVPNFVSARTLAVLVPEFVPAISPTYDAPIVAKLAISRNVVSAISCHLRIAGSQLGRSSTLPLCTGNRKRLISARPGAGHLKVIYSAEIEPIVTLKLSGTICCIGRFSRAKHSRTAGTRGSRSDLDIDARGTPGWVSHRDG
jgi:hypothetical protein